jgi:hypothetical protein
MPFTPFVLIFMSSFVAANGAGKKLKGHVRRLQQLL